MFPFRPSRTAAALLELAEAMLAPEAFEPVSADELDHAVLRNGEIATGEAAQTAERSRPATRHPHRRAAAIDRRRRPSPQQPELTCLTPVARALRARDPLRA